MAHPRATNRNERGAAMVEFALILPILLMLVFGIIEFGRAYNHQVTLTHAAREGVREYAINQDAGAAGATAAAAATSLNPSLLSSSVSGCPGGNARMELTYPFEFSIPFVPLGPITITGVGVMRCGA